MLCPQIKSTPFRKSISNIAFYLRLVGMAREHIAAGDFKPWKEQMVQKLTRRL